MFQTAGGGPSLWRVFAYLGCMKNEAKFTLDVILDGEKSINVDEETGDLYIEGYASDFDMDRQQEAFEPGAFEKGLADFMRNPVLAFHHNNAMQLGQVIETRMDQKGLWIKARVDAPEPGTIMADHYRKIKRGTMRGFSVAGQFYRRMGADGQRRIHRADLHEISVTPLPVNPRTLFSVAQKAFDDAPEADELQERIDRAAALMEKFERVCHAGE